MMPACTSCVSTFRPTESAAIAKCIPLQILLRRYISGKGDIKYGEIFRKVGSRCGFVFPTSIIITFDVIRNSQKFCFNRNEEKGGEYLVEFAYFVYQFQDLWRCHRGYKNSIHYCRVPPHQRDGVEKCEKITKDRPKGIPVAPPFEIGLVVNHYFRKWKLLNSVVKYVSWAAMWMGCENVLGHWFSIRYFFLIQNW